MWMEHPDIAQEFEKKTVNMKKLPEHVEKKKDKK